MGKTYVAHETLSAYRRDGYAVIRNVFDRDEVKAIKREFFRLWAERLLDGGISHDPRLPMESMFPTMHEVNRDSETIRKFMLDPRQFAIAEKLLGDEALIVGTTCFFKAPRTQALPFHQDNIDNGCEPAANCALWTSLDGSDRENGSLCFIPGTHRLGLLSINAPADHKYGLLAHRVPAIGEHPKLPEPYRIVHIQTNPGDVVVFDGNTIHGSNANVTADRFRLSFATHFTTAGVERVYANFNHLIDREGRIVSKTVNKRHGRIRAALLPDHKMSNGDKIY